MLCMITWWSYTLIQPYFMTTWWNYAKNNDDRPFAHKSYNTNSDDHEDSWSKTFTFPNIIVINMNEDSMYFCVFC